MQVGQPSPTVGASSGEGAFSMADVGQGCPTYDPAGLQAKSDAPIGCPYDVQQRIVFPMVSLFSSWSTEEFRLIRYNQ
jgi:hypothetical protein